LASLDQFLQALAKNNMEKLSLLPDQPARLTRAGEEFDITKGPLAARVVRSAIAEIAPPGSPGTPRNRRDGRFRVPLGWCELQDSNLPGRRWLGNGGHLPFAGKWSVGCRRIRAYQLGCAARGR